MIRKIVVLISLLLLPLVVLGGETKIDRFEKVIVGFEEKDKASAPPKDATVFVGSSSFALWKTLETDLQPIAAVNRGFGGSTLAEVTHYVDRIVIPYKPKAVVIYAGENDLSTHKNPQQAADDFKQLIAALQKALPETRLYYISMKPSIKRWALWDLIKEGNAKIRAEADKMKVTFIDIGPGMLENGAPRKDIFKADDLHMNEKGYTIWIPIIKAALGETK